MPGRSEVLAWQHSLSADLAPPNNAIILGVIPVDVSWQFEAAFDGAALHEAFHGIYSCRRPLTYNEIFDLVVKNWARIPDWGTYLNFLLEAHNHVEDVRIERVGVQDYPGSQGPLEALNEYCLGAYAGATHHVRVKEERKETSRLRRLLALLFCLGHSLQTPAMLRYVGEARDSDPDLLQQIEEGPYADILRQIREMDLRDDLAALRIALNLASLLVSEDLATELPAEVGGGPSPSCPACGAPTGKLRGLLLPRQDTSDPRRKLVVSCTACGHCEQVEVEPGNQGAGGADPASPTLQVIDLEQPPASPDPGLAAQVPLVKPGEFFDKEGVMTAAAEQAWQDQAPPGSQAPAGKARAPYRPYSPGSDNTIVVPVSEELRPEAEKLRAEVEGQVCALRTGLRRVVRSLQKTTVRAADDGTDLFEDHLADTLYELDHGRLPPRAFAAESEQVDPSAAVVVVIDLSDSMKSWVRCAGMVMLAVSLAMEDLRFAVACIGFRDGAPLSLPTAVPRAVAGCHRKTSVDILVFKHFQERTAAVLPRFAQIRAGSSTPMADGLQAALEAIRTRTEPLRIVLVVTDGLPNGGTEPVIVRQVELAQQGGIHVCGVGVGADAAGVGVLFPRSIHAREFSEVPQRLVAHVRDLILGRLRDRG